MTAKKSKTYVLVDEKHVWGILDRLGLDMKQEWSWPSWKSRTRNVGHQFQLTILERLLFVDHEGCYAHWQRRNIKTLIQKFSAMLATMGLEKFMAFPTLCDGENGMFFLNWYECLRPKGKGHDHYRKFMKNLQMPDNFNGGISFELDGLHPFLDVATQYAFDCFLPPPEKRVKRYGMEDIVFISVDKPCLFVLSNHSCILAQPPNRALAAELRSAIRQSGLYLDNS